MANHDHLTGDWDFLETLRSSQRRPVAEVVTYLSDARAQGNAELEPTLRRTLTWLSRDLCGDQSVLPKAFDRAWANVERKRQHTA